MTNPLFIELTRDFDKRKFLIALADIALVRRIGTNPYTTIDRKNGSAVEVEESQSEISKLLEEFIYRGPQRAAKDYKPE